MSERLKSLLQLYEKDPKDSFLIYGIALEYISSENYEKAEEYLNVLLKQDPIYVPGYMQLALLKEKQDKIEEAKNIYKQGISTANETGDLQAAKEMEDFLDDL